MTRLCFRVGGEKFNSHSFALCLRAVDIADNFVVLDLMLVVDGGYRNVVPVRSAGIERDNISCSAPIRNKPGLHATAQASALPANRTLTQHRELPV